MQIFSGLMASTKLHLDKRRITKNNTYPLKLTISFKNKVAHIPLDIKLTDNQWDEKKEKIINHPKKLSLNSFIAQQKIIIDEYIAQHGREISDINRLKSKLMALLYNEGEVDDYFDDWMENFIKPKKEGTQALYRHTLSRMQQFSDNDDKILLSAITYDWLVDFEAFLAKTANKNARNIHLRNIRAVMNFAIDNNVNVSYPFKRFKIRPVPTAKRSLTIDEIRTLFNYPVEEYAKLHLDMFKLIFYLIGINIVDLFNLEKINNEGRIEFYRAKTNRLYSIKVEPEAYEIINKYKGKNKLLCMADTYKKHNDYAKHLNRALQNIGSVDYGKRGKKTITPLFPELTTYWARHTWATIASSLDIPKDTIAAALGHGAYTVTDIYIDFDRNKIDQANRKVLDWVLYNKK